MYAALLRQLADFKPLDAPVLSIYLDMQPHAIGGRPALRDDVLRLGDRLRQIEKTFGPRGPDVDSFRADAARIETYLRDHYPVSAHGVAIFACDAAGLFEVVEAHDVLERLGGVGALLRFRHEAPAAAERAADETQRAHD